MPYPAFDITVFLLDQIFQVLIMADLYAVNGLAAGIKFHKGSCVCTAFIDGHHFWLTVLANGLMKEKQGSSRITFRRQQKVNGPAISINSAVQIFPLASDFDIRFVHSPPATHSTFVPAKRPVQPGYQANGPSMKCGVINSDTALCHNFLKIAQAERVRQVPADKPGDNIDGIMEASERLSD